MDEIGAIGEQAMLHSLTPDMAHHLNAWISRQDSEGRLGYLDTILQYLQDNPDQIDLNWRKIIDQNHYKN
jgi:hypothetical protein